MHLRCPLALFAFFASLTAGFTAHAQSLDEVATIDGGRIRGIVVVEDGEGVLIELADGTTRKIPRAEIMKISYGDATDAAPAEPATAPTAVLPDRASRDDGGGNVGRGLWVSGAISWGVIYAATVGTAGGVVAANDSDPTTVGIAAIPLAGPFAVIGVEGDNLETGHIGGIVALGASQILAATLFFIGVGIDASSSSSHGAAQAPPRPPVGASPWLTPDAGGGSVFGAF